MQIIWTCFKPLGDDAHYIFAFINGKISSFLGQHLQIISAYLLPELPFLNQRKEKRKYVTRLGIEPRTSGS